MNKILIVGPAWVGDMVMSQSLYMTLKKEYPSIEIDVVAPAAVSAILDRMPEVKTTYTLPVGHNELGLGRRISLGRRLLKNGYDWAIVLANTFKSALVPWVARIPRRTGFLGEMRYGLLSDIRKLNKESLPTMVDRYLSLAYADGTCKSEFTRIAPKLAFDPMHASALMERLQLVKTKPVVTLCPGAAYGPSKQWPVEYFQKLAQLLVTQGYHIWLLGSSKEKPICDVIEQSVQEGVQNLAGLTNLNEAIDILSLSDSIVCHDSGLMHIAAALDKTILSLYGSSSSDHTPPLSPTAHTLKVGLDCQPCFQRVCPLGHHKCMKDMSPEFVFEKMQEFGMVS